MNQQHGMTRYMSFSKSKYSLTQVLFKRKPVKFDPPPKNVTDHDEV